MTEAADPSRLPDDGASALLDPRGRQGSMVLRGHLILTAPARAGARSCLLATLAPPPGGLAGAVRAIAAPWMPATATRRFGRGY